MSVLVVGIRGVGIETVKNLALQGAGTITLVDPYPAQPKDVGVNFFIHESDLAYGKSRAELVAPRARELNPMCNLRTAPALTDEVIAAHSAVVITQMMPLNELVRINEFCRANGISFFFAYTGGVSASLFTDHGDNHFVIDPNGERPVQKLVIDMKSLGNGETILRYDHPAGQNPVTLSTGNYEISELIGANDLNDKVFACSHPGSDPAMTLRIPVDIDTLSTPYVSGGLIVEKKLPTKYPMQSLAVKIKEPGNPFADPPSMVLTDLINFGSETQQHVAWVGLLKFFSKFNRLPEPNNVAEAAAVVDLAKDALASSEIVLEEFELDTAFVNRFAIHSGAELQPMAAFVGGVLAQEVVKCSGKYTPIPGFMHFTAAEALPNEALLPSDTAPRGHPNDELAAVYGWTFVEKLGNLKYFMVGCGALGCEFMKNFALNGIFAGPQGKLIVTDADRIELSNLTRQFLFREHNVGQPKSRAAAAMATVMNPRFKVEALEMFVGHKTEDTFNDEFWLGLDGVCNALDNMEARLYVDKQCVKYEKSLLESGTMGVNGNVDTICPFKTRTYADGGQAAEGGDIPMCTLRNFPQVTDHCIEWARDQFELLFVKLGKTCEIYLEDPRQFENDMLGKSEGSIFETRALTSMMQAASNPSIGSAAQLAFDFFHFLFRDRILDLQATYPKNARIITKEGVDKGPFWSEKKRYPTAAIFNPDDESHTSFLLSATCLFSVVLGVLPPKAENDNQWLAEYRNKEFIAGLASTLTPPIYVRAPIHNEEDETNDTSNLSATDILSGPFADLRKVAATTTLPKMVPADFEKDDDLNFHIAFINSTANLRCDNYSIKRTNFQSTKVIAGKIIAAIATTTSAVCGLVMLELFKLQLCKDTEAFMNRQIGLGTNAYTSFTQEPPKPFSTFTEVTTPDGLPSEAYDEKGKVKDEYLERTVKLCYPDKHTVWDKVTVSGSFTLKGFADWLSSEHGLKMTEWNFNVGTKIMEVDGKKKESALSTPIYPPKVDLDYSQLPSLELSIPQATIAINKNAGISPGMKMKYIAAWKDFKIVGVIPPQPPRDPHEITADTSLKEKLLRMEAIGVTKETTKEIVSKTCSGIASRRFWVTDAPTCISIETSDSVEHMAQLKIVL